MKGFTTRIVHSDRQKPIEHGSLQKPVHATVAYGYEDARDLAAAFQGTGPGHTYGRQVNPTVDALQDKITTMEGGLQSVCFSTGMAAIGTTLFALLRAGDHFVSSSFLFGNTNSLFNTFTTQGIDVSFVDATDPQAVRAAVREETRLVFVETIANPRTQVSALAEIGALCEELSLVYFVDNTMTSPYLFQPKSVRASLVINSLTKYIGGHGNALGGSVTEMGQYDWRGFDNIYDTYRKGDPQKWAITQVKKKGLRDFGAALAPEKKGLRDFGAALAPEAAHHLAIGAETLGLRLEQQCASTRAMAEFLDGHPLVKAVYFPGLAAHPEHDRAAQLFRHPEHDRAAQLFRHPGALFSFELDSSVDLWDFLNRLEVIVKSSNLGDNRTLAIPVAHTIYYEMGPERRASMGIDDSLIRISVGIEDTDDLIEDLRQAFDR
jgi:O-acetylhomoserine (thiol)-lyase